MTPKDKIARFKKKWDCDMNSDSRFQSMNVLLPQNPLNVILVQWLYFRSHHPASLPFSLHPSHTDSITQQSLKIEILNYKFL